MVRTSESQVGVAWSKVFFFFSLTAILSLKCANLKLLSIFKEKCSYFLVCSPVSGDFLNHLLFTFSLDELLNRFVPQIHTFKRVDYHPCWRGIKLALSWVQLALCVSSHHICTRLSLGLDGGWKSLVDAGSRCAAEFRLCRC